MSVFYLFGYWLGTSIVIKMLVLPVVILIALMIQKKRKTASKNQLNHDFKRCQATKNQSTYIPQSNKPEIRQAEKNEMIRKKKIKKLQKQYSKQSEKALLKRISELDIQYPLIQRFHSTEINYTCKSKSEFENADLELIALEFIRSNPKEMQFYKTVILPNAKNKLKFDAAFKSEIECHTTKRSILRKKKRKGQISTMGMITLSYYYKDKTSKKRKQLRRVAVLDSMDKLFNEVKNGVIRQSEKEHFVKKQRAAMSNSLRYDILKRDGFRCQICGATQNDGVKLHVDHIIPVSKGGKTEKSNLRTLCDMCNLGKGAKIEDDQAHCNRVTGATIEAICNNL